MQLQLRRSHIEKHFPTITGCCSFAPYLSLRWGQSEREKIEQVEKSGPVLYYTFDSRSGEAVANEVGNKHSGQCIKASFTDSRSAGMALSVRTNNVQSGYVETADHEDLNAPTFTITAWIKLRRENSNGSVVCNHDWLDGKRRGYVLRCYTAEFVNFTIGAGGWIRANGTTPVPANQWVHVAGAIDGTYVKVFFNGLLEGTTEVLPLLKPHLKNGDPEVVWRLNEIEKAINRVDNAQ